MTTGNRAITIQPSSTELTPRLGPAAVGLNADFERLGDDTRSGKRSEERLREEEAWSRMDDEGCPNGDQRPYPRQDIIRIRGAAAEARPYGL